MGNVPATSQSLRSQSPCRRGTSHANQIPASAAAMPPPLRAAASMSKRVTRPRKASGTRRRAHGTIENQVVGRSRANGRNGWNASPKMSVAAAAAPNDRRIGLEGLEQQRPGRHAHHGDDRHRAHPTRRTLARRRRHRGAGDPGEDRIG